MNHAGYSQEAFAAAARQTAAEGCVLLRNKAHALPLKQGERAAVFGRAQMNYFKSGLGSGGKVNTRYVTGVWEALSKEEAVTLDARVRTAYEQWTVQHPYDMGDGWAGHPWYQAEMPLEDSLVSAAAARNDAAGGHHRSICGGLPLCRQFRRRSPMCVRRGHLRGLPLFRDLRPGAGAVSLRQRTVLHDLPA